MMPDSQTYWFIWSVTNVLVNLFKCSHKPELSLFHVPIFYMLSKCFRYQKQAHSRIWRSNLCASKGNFTVGFSKIALMAQRLNWLLFQSSPSQSIIIYRVSSSHFFCAYMQTFRVSCLQVAHVIGKCIKLS